MTWEVNRKVPFVVRQVLVTRRIHTRIQTCDPIDKEKRESVGLKLTELAQRQVIASVIVNGIKAHRKLPTLRIAKKKSQFNSVLKEATLPLRVRAKINNVIHL